MESSIKIPVISGFSPEQVSAIMTLYRQMIRSELDQIHSEIREIRQLLSQPNPLSSIKSPETTPPSQSHSNRRRNGTKGGGLKSRFPEVEHFAFPSSIVASKQVVPKIARWLATVCWRLVIRWNKMTLDGAINECGVTQMPRYGIR